MLQFLELDGLAQLDLLHQARDALVVLVSWAAHLLFCELFVNCIN